MAFISAFRRVLGGSSTHSSLNVRSQFASIRLNSTLVTLTSPKLFISGLSRSTTNENLYNAFLPFGRIREAKVITDRGSGRSKGFGFITYETVEEAEKAREEMNAKYLDGWVIFVDPAKPREFQPPPRPYSNFQSDPSSAGTGYTTNKTVGWSG